jgi:hypothetical protein
MSHSAQHLAVPIRAAAVLDARASLLFGAPARRRSLLLPTVGDRGRGRAVVDREGVIARHLAALPAGAEISMGEVIAACGLRLSAGQRRSIGAVLISLGFSPKGAGRARRYVRRGTA